MEYNFASCLNKVTSKNENSIFQKNTSGFHHKNGTFLICNNNMEPLGTKGSTSANH